MEVAPLAGAWIEICLDLHSCVADPVAPLAGAWIEILNEYLSRADDDVAPLAGAWIEITASITLRFPFSGCRSPRGSVD